MVQTQCSGCIRSCLRLLTPQICWQKSTSSCFCLQKLSDLVGAQICLTFIYIYIYIPKKKPQTTDHSTELALRNYCRWNCSGRSESVIICLAEKGWWAAGRRTRAVDSCSGWAVIKTHLTLLHWSATPSYMWCMLWLPPEQSNTKLVCCTHRSGQSQSRVGSLSCRVSCLQSAEFYSLSNVFCAGFCA